MIGIYVLIVMIVMIIVLSVCGVIFLGWLITKLGPSGIELPEKRAGRLGENFASTVIQEILHDDDIMLTNVRIMAEGKETELDNLIINKHGIFIIEVKNYSGELFGEEGDDDWIKTKMTPGGSFYQKTVRNPIKQVNRQIYILSRFLKENDIHVWIEGYVFFVQNNSPIESKYVLRTQRDIDMAIHGGEVAVREEDVRKIEEMFC